ncbi:MAG TPA: hypothetical protein VGL76_09275 [Gaiellaceae bacterium]|jgi:hypothetical protein
MTADDIAGFVALGGGAVVLTTQRGFNPAVPAIAAPLAVAWPHGAPALGAGVALGALTLARPRRLPGPAYLFAVALAITIAITGDGGLVRGAAAAIAVAVVAPAYVRTVEDLVVACIAFGLASGGVALAASVNGTGGVRADLIAVAAAGGIALAGTSGARAVAAVDLAGVLALPSKAGVVAAAVAVIGLLLVRRLPPLDAILAGIATALAWIAGAPFAHAPWRSLNAFSDSYHRLGPAGAAIFVLLLAATLWGLPRPFAPGALVAVAGAAFAPVEATATLFLFAGFAASSSSPEGRLHSSLDERRLLERERELDEEKKRLRRRREALDEREAQLALREGATARPAPPQPTVASPPPSAFEPPAPPPTPPPPPPPPPEPEPEFVRPADGPLQPRFQQWNLAALAALVEAQGPGYPDRYEEWQIYLETLAPYVENGVLPARFDSTVVDVFGPLLGDATSV